MRSASRWSRPTATCGRSRACCSISARGSGCRASSPTTAAPRYPGGYADYIVNHERSPGIGSLAGFRGADGKSYGRGAPNPKQLDAYIADGCFHEHHLAPEQRYYKHANKAYLEWAKDVGFIGAAAPITFQLYLEPLQKFRLAARGHGAVKPPATPSRARSRNISIRFRSGIRRSTAAPASAIPFSAITQRPMHMYHSWGSHNGWLRQITAENCLYMQSRPRAKARHRRRRLGLDQERASAASRAASG